MNYKELVTSIAVKNNLPIKLAKIYVESVLNIISQCIKDDEPLQTPFLKMGVILRPEKVIKDQKTGKIEKHVAVKFGKVIVKK